MFLCNFRIFFSNYPSRIVASIIGLLIVCSVNNAYAAMDPRFELDPLALGTKPAIKTKNVKVKAGASQSVAPRKRKTDVLTASQGTIHVVKSGDNLFKILIRDYKLSNDEAELLIERIRSENNIYDIKRLKVGQKITIPPVRRNIDGSIQGLTTAPSDSLFSSRSVGQSFMLETPVRAFSEEDANLRFRQTWDKIIPPHDVVVKPVVIQSPTFSLTLDPQRFPQYATMSNERILIDSNSSIPPLVKALITEKEPSVKIVSEHPSDGKRFMAAILSNAGFYSVEEDFNLEFGVDPKLSIRSDFKIEKTADSLIKQDVTLMNSGRVALPTVITGFLKKEGFSVFEPFTSLQPVVPSPQQPMYQITAKSQSEIIDALLTSLSVAPDSNRRLDVFSADNSGISLSVNAERYFERSGQRTVVTRFDGDPVSYTLFRILETMGYHVIILGDQDGFRSITDKLLANLKINGEYEQHLFSWDSNANYSLKMSGYKLEGVGLPPGGVFLTNIMFDQVVRDLLNENGYSITTK